MDSRINLILTLAYGGLLLLVSSAGSTAHAASINLSSGNTSYLVGGSFSVDIQVDSEGANVVVADTMVTYDPSLLQLDSIDAGVAYNNFFFPFGLADPTSFPIIRIDNIAGQGQVIVGRPTPGLNGAMLNVARLNFTVLAISSGASVDIDFTGVGAAGDSSVIQDDGLGTDLLDIVSGLTLTLDVDTDGDGTGNTIDTDDDNDGLLDIDETNTGTYVSPGDTGTNPLIADTDGDGVNDGLEVAANTDPTDSSSTPVLNDGDANNDGVVNAADLVIAIRILAGLRVATALEIAHLDVSPLVSGVPAPNGEFNLGDYLVLVRKVTGVISF